MADSRTGFGVAPAPALGVRFTQSVAYIRGLLTRSDSIQPPPLRAAIDRERERSDRTGQPFSLVLLDGHGAPAAPALYQLIVMRRVRSLDEVGQYDHRRVGILLPATAEAGATIVAETVRQTAASKGHQVFYSIQTYAPRRNGDHGDGEAPPPRRGGQARTPSASEPRLPALFLLGLPASKRAMDLIGALLGIVLASPLMVVAAVAVKLSSRGPILFRQQRAGLGGKPFRFLKFRTMRVTAESEKLQLMPYNEQSGPVFKMKRDPRVTPVGRILRKTSIDELPQLWNVIRGEMSLVGPRPATLDEVALYQPWQMRRLSVTPGLTCIWQVSGRSAVGFEDWVRMDIRYLSKGSLMLDFAILLRTLPAVLSGRGAH